MDDIDWIAQHITEDPNIILENNIRLFVEYTNIIGERKKYEVLRIFKDNDARDPTGFYVLWPDKSVGYFVADSESMSPESYERCKRLSEPNNEYWRLKRHYINLRRHLSPLGIQRSRYHKWQYMFKTYGRCCPKWFDNNHVTGQRDCHQNPHFDEYILNDIFSRIALSDEDKDILLNSYNKYYKDKEVAPLDIYNVSPQLDQAFASKVPPGFRKYNTDYGEVTVVAQNDNIYTVYIPGEEVVEVPGDQLEQYLYDQYDIDASGGYK